LSFLKPKDSKGSQPSICRRHASIDRELQIKEFGGRSKLRVEISEVRNLETVRDIDWRRTRGRRSVIVEKVRFES
jgi:hypothetical protein